MNNYLFERKGDYVASTGYAQLRTNQITRYIFQLLHSENFVNEAIEKCTGTSFPSISSKDLGKIIVPIPHKDEQRKIANYFTALDAKIEFVGSQISKVQEFKRGLSHQMFL
jgi:type I restriction enzyme S subunit